jgi:ankyrin repeat protein
MASLNSREHTDRRSENIGQSGTWNVETSNESKMVANPDENPHSNRQSLYDNVSANDEPNKAFLLAAARSDAARVGALLADPSVDVNTKTAGGQTALWYAAATGSEAVVKLLLARAGVDINAADYSQQHTPLMRASENGHLTVARLLLARDGIEVNKRSNEKQTALCYAAVGGHEEMVRLLLAADGIEVNTRDVHSGRTPLSWAVYHGHEAVVRLLQDAGGIDTSPQREGFPTPFSIQSFQSQMMQMSRNARMTMPTP